MMGRWRSSALGGPIIIGGEHLQRCRRRRIRGAWYFAPPPPPRQPVVFSHFATTPARCWRAPARRRTPYRVDVGGVDADERGVECARGLLRRGVGAEPDAPAAVGQPLISDAQLPDLRRRTPLYFLLLMTCVDGADNTTTIKLYCGGLKAISMAEVINVTEVRH